LPCFDSIVYEPQINQAIQAMEDRARALGITHGVGIAYVQTKGAKPEVRVCVIDSIDREVNPDKPDDWPTNYMGIAWSKLAYSFRTGLSSGEPNKFKLKRGESEFMGCRVLNLPNGKAFFFFSGDTEDKDVQVSLAGIDAFLPFRL